jgi:hypothetical protein
MKHFALLFSVLLLSSAAFAGGRTFNWIVQNPNNYHWICGASGTCDMEGVAGTRALRSGITVTRIQYESTDAIYINSSNQNNVGAPCPDTPTITLTNGINSYILYVENDGISRYTDSGSISVRFVSGTKLSSQTDFLVSHGDPITQVYESCTTPVGTIIVNYAIP